MINEPKDVVSFKLHKCPIKIENHLSHTKNVNLLRNKSKELSLSLSPSQFKLKTQQNNTQHHSRQDGLYPSLRGLSLLLLQFFSDLFILT